MLGEVLGPQDELVAMVGELVMGIRALGIVI
jgi:hypothetical protein